MTKALVDWSEENIATLKRMWSDGASATAIASAIPNATRNVVCGKAWRLGLGLTAEEIKERRGRSNKMRAPRSVKPKRGSHVMEMFRRSVGLPEPSGPFFCMVIDLDARRCRFPIGEPEEPGFRFCGYKTESDGAPYCPYHMALAHVPTKLARRAA